MYLVQVTYAARSLLYLPRYSPPLSAQEFIKIEFTSSCLTPIRQTCKMTSKYGGDKRDKTSPS
ncbi:MAG: hypothetical protein ACK56F_26440, partial [bacterium]